MLKMINSNRWQEMLRNIAIDTTLNCYVIYSATLKSYNSGALNNLKNHSGRGKIDNVYTPGRAVGTRTHSKHI